MTAPARWFLPEGIEEILPPQARRIEQLRRAILDLFDSWGYEWVAPPLIEYVDALLTGTDADLDQQTFKLTDPLSGRQLGLRADITPQAARLDAHHLRREVPTRLGYLGPVLHTQAEGFNASRDPLQFGAELFGHAGVESDGEIVQLMWHALALVGVREIYLDLGHVGIFRGLAQQASLNLLQERELFAALQRKAMSEVAALLHSFAVSGAIAEMLLALTTLDGADALQRATTVLAAAAPPVHAALEHLSQVALQVRQALPAVPVHFDLAELRGYHYKTGVVFAAFIPGSGQEIARGGRYDGIGQVFGRARPAVGFSADLKRLLRLTPTLFEHAPAASIAAPWSHDPALLAAINALRQQGRRVITLLPGQTGNAADLGCTQQLTWRDARWLLEPLVSSPATAITQSSV